MKCDYCNKTLTELDSSTSCAKCGKVFCLNLNSPCASDYHKDKPCAPSFVSILEPGLMIKLNEPSKEK